MKLETIIKDCKTKIIQGNTYIEITGIEQDSRKIKQGNMFVAIEGFTVDGHNYINEAINNGGAICVVVEKKCIY